MIKHTTQTGHTRTKLEIEGQPLVLTRHCVAVCCSVLQYVAVCCSVLQCVAVCCSVLQCVTVCCSVLQCVAVCCSVLQCVVVCCSVLHTATHCNTLQHTATHCNTLQHTATHTKETWLQDMLGHNSLDRASACSHRFVLLHPCLFLNVNLCVPAYSLSID